MTDARTPSVNLSPSDYVIIGGTGDLALRKILPALFWRYLDGQITSDYRIAAASRRDISPEDYAGMLRPFCEDAFSSGAASEDDWTGFLALISMITLDVQGGAGGDHLAGFINERADSARPTIFYLAIAPSLFGDATRLLRDCGLATPQARLVVEKPLGHDGASSRAINAELAEIFDESQIYRIDHYLGKETVQNLMALRFANALYEPLWNSAHIDHVQITVAETVGLEDRVTYYDKAGALRDMVQNHMLQLLCLVAMEAPSSMDADAVRDEKLKVLRALKRINGTEAPKHTVRGQYRAGASAGGPVKGYVEELGSESNTETFVAIKAEIANWRWAGVPFYLRTGKRLAARVSEIVIEFKPIPHSIFNGDSAGPIFANQLVIRLQPDEGVKQYIMIKDPGPGGMRLRQISLDMSFAQQFQSRAPDAYERLIMDVIRGNQTLFMRRDEVEAAWKWIDPIQNAWENAKQDAQGYTAGTWGPSASIALIERDGRTWHESN